MSPNRRRAAGILAVVLLALIGLVALASSRSGLGDSGGEPVPSNAFWDYLVTLTLAGAAASAAILLWAVATGRGTKLPARKDQNLRALVIFGAFMLAIVLIVRSNRLNLPSLRSDEPPPAATSTTATSSDPAEPAPYDPRFRWELLAVLGGLAAVTVGVFAAYNRRNRGELRQAEELAQELAALLDDTLEDLHAERDPRRAVIAAYARMERVLAAHGLPRISFEAPLEYLDRIAAELPAASAQRLVFELTHLYERARFSLHEIDEGMKAEAIATLVSLREELADEERAA